MEEDELIAENAWIMSVAVEGLHNRLSFQVDLKPGVNIIYGKNGLGKTTLLHVIANLSEIEISRFEYLSFSHIIVSSSTGETVRLEKREGKVAVYINDQSTSYEHSKSLSEVERASIRRIVGQRSTYLPAFRSVLERMRETAYNPFAERSRPEFEAMQQAEARAFRSVDKGERTLRRDGSLIESNVLKTMRCREWFGPFVPVIRYPSVSDVVSGLSDEWSAAQIAIGKIEQKQFESAFVEIFSAIAQGDASSAHIDQTFLLDKIKELVSADDGRVQGPTRMSAYLRLVDIAEKTDGSDRNYSNILQIYHDKLLDRKREREDVLSPMNVFQESVNVFLTDKSFRIGNRSLPSINRIRESKVFIEPDTGKYYSLKALSSGERQIVTMLYSASRSQFKSGCLLIDEPELSLHVDWQRIILSQIEKQHQGRQIIACTHSPEVGADHEDRVQFFEPQAVSVPDEEFEGEESSVL